MLGNVEVFWVTELGGDVAHGCEQWLPGSGCMTNRCTFAFLRFDDATLKFNLIVTLLPKSKVLIYSQLSSRAARTMKLGNIHVDYTPP